MITKELIDQFKEFTGSDSDEVARQTLEACDANLETAVQLHFANDAHSENHIQVNHAAQVVDDDIEIIDETVRQVDPAPVVLGDSTDEDEDGVRRPIAPVNAQLIGESYPRQARRNAPNPIFEQYENISAPTGRRRIAHNGNVTQNESNQNSGSSRDLAAIFRPPIDIMSRHDWDGVLRAARNENRWILVNIQDPNEFACQTLNRDCWSDETLKEIIKAHFLFWQVYAESSDGRRIVGYYALKKFPAIFIIDPRTSEKVHDITCDKPAEMIVELSEFYERYPTFSSFDAELRAKMTPILSKQIDFELDDEESNHSNGMDVDQQPSTSNHALPDKNNLPSTSSADPVQKINPGPIEQPSAESLRERREKFLRQFEK